MDYKEKFEDFLDKMQGLLDNAKKQGHIIVRVEDLENALTELKEGDEDERIRKSLIEYFRWNVQQLLNDFSNKEVVVWLEKQGKLVNSLSKGLDNAHERIDELIQKNNELCLKLEKQGEPNPYSGISLDYNGHTWGMCARDDGVDILLDKQLFKHLEKQSEQKIPVVDFKAEDWYVSKVDGKIYNAKFMESSEKQGKQVEINPSEFDLRLNKLLKQFETLSKEELASSLSFYLNVVQNDGTYIEEKQSEQKDNNKLIWKHWSGCGIAGNGDDKQIYLIKQYNTYILSSCLSFECDYILLSDLDKLLPQKFEVKSAEESLGISSEEYNDIVNERLYGESKTAEKVEPKFKVGDWVVDNCDYVWKIEGILNQFYLLEGVEGGESRPTIEWVNKTFHLWAIQDAKDGDVLAEDTCIFIIKKLNHDLSAEIYCCLYDDGDFDINSNLVFDDTSTYPATKEQRALLFKKMKELGYEWDAEKKELKKISQHIVSAEAKEALYDKPTWSEEDEKMIQDIISDIAIAQEQVYCKNRCEDEINWLKSLRPQNHWKPSDEQMGVIEAVINNKSFQRRHLNSLYEQLKKLKGE